MFSRALVILSATCMVLAATPRDLLAADLSGRVVKPSALVAASIPYPDRWEIRAGGYAHDPYSPEGGSADLNLEVLSPKLWHADGWVDLIIPRAHVGGTINFAGKTSQAYAGVAWTFDLPWRLFVEGTFDGEVNDGQHGRFPTPGFNALGCTVMFHESGSLGYRLTDHWNLIGTVEHSSNAGLCSQNRGLTNYGARIGYVF